MEKKGETVKNKGPQVTIIPLKILPEVLKIILVLLTVAIIMEITTIKTVTATIISIMEGILTAGETMGIMATLPTPTTVRMEEVDIKTTLLREDTKNRIILKFLKKALVKTRESRERIGMLWKI